MRTRTAPKLATAAGVVLSLAICGSSRCDVVRENFHLLGVQESGDFGAFGVANNIVFLLEANRIVAVDMSDPARPVELSRRSPEFDATAIWILTTGTHVLAPTISDGMHIYDYSNPATPSFAGRFAPYTTYRLDNVRLDGDRLYFGGRRFVIFDITNPTAPVELANHAIASKRMAVSDGRAVVTGDSRDPIHMYDVRDPANPVYLGQLYYLHSSASAPPWHSEIAMRWPMIAVENGWYELEWQCVRWLCGGIPGWSWHCSCMEWDWVPVAKSGLNLYRPNGAGLWNRLHAPGEATDMALTANRLFVGNAETLSAYDPNTLSLVGLVPTRSDQLAVEGSRLYSRNYASIEVFDAASPATPTLLGTWEGFGSSVLALGDDRAYVLGKDRYLTVFDTTNTSSPRRTGTGPRMKDPQAADIVGQYLYIADGIEGLLVFSLADPDWPTHVAAAHVPGGAQDFAIAGTRAYVTGWSELLRVFDLADPSSPVTMGTVPDPTTVRDSYAVTVAGDQAYVLAWHGDYTDRSLITVNVRFPASPWMVRLDKTRDLQYGRRLMAVGNALFVLDEPEGRAGVVYDISNPTSFTRIGEFASGGKMAYANGWMFVTEGPQGLHAYSVDDPTNVWDGGFAGDDLETVAVSGDLVFGVTKGNDFTVMRFSPPDPVDLNPQGFALAAPGAGLDQPIDFLGRIDNLGPAATSQSFWVEFAAVPVDRPGPTVLLCDSLFVPPGLAAGESVSLAGLGRTLYGPEKGVMPGRYIVAVVADAPNEIPETRERNNILLADGEFTVWLSANDLRPSVLDFAPRQVAPGETIILSGSIEYTGVEPSADAFWVEFWCSPNADFSGPRYYLCDSMIVGAGLAPGTAYQFSISRSVYDPSKGLPSGLYFVGAIVDPTDAIPERSETNNAYWRATDKLLVGATSAQNWHAYR